MTSQMYTVCRPCPSRKPSTRPRPYHSGGARYKHSAHGQGDGQFVPRTLTPWEPMDTTEFNIPESDEEMDVSLIQYMY